MTESMLTTRLSSVITGCGGKETTCSRRSISGLMRSTNGTTSARPGVRVREYRPSRSTTAARACGMIRTVRTSVMSTKSTMTAGMIQKYIQAPLFIDESGCALDLGHLDAQAGLEHLVGHVCAR